MFPQFGATAESFTKASSMVFKIGTDAHLYDDPDDVNIAPLLDSKFDLEKAEALKRLMALIAQGFDVSNLFPQVVKNVASQSLEVKKLVYLYLLHYAKKRPNEALLSINCFQKDLSDPNPLVRAWALRAMAGIRLHAIAPLVLVALTKCSRDPSTYVRKCAANALPKLYDLHQEQNVSALEELVGILLSDHSPGVVGAAAAAFNSVCPDNLQLIGRNFRRLCETLPDVEEWGQVVLIGILLRYIVARHGLIKESVIFSSCLTCSACPEKSSEDVHVLSDNGCGFLGDGANEFRSSASLFRFYIGQDDCFLRSSYTSGDDARLEGTVFTSDQNSDVKVLLQCTSPLLWSQNSAVVLAAAGVHWIMAPREDAKRIVKPLLFLLRSSIASQYVVLCNIKVFTKAMPSLFAPHFEDFFISSSDSYQLRALKLEILSTIGTDSSILLIFQEFQDYINDPDRRFVADTVAAIGICAQRLPSVANTCLQWLLTLIKQECSINALSSKDGEASVLAQAVTSIKSIIKQNTASHEKVIIQLIRSLDAIKVPAARARILWILGEYSSIGQNIQRILPTILKYLAWCFTKEELETKQQILNATAKVVIHSQGEDLFTFKRVLIYILELAKFDLNYDVRDRARAIKKLLACHIASECLEGGKPCLQPKADLHRELAEHIFGDKAKLKSDSFNNGWFYLPGSLSQIVSHAAPGYEPLPKPCSLDDGFLSDLGIVDGTKPKINSLGTTDPDAVSGSSDVESGSSYSSRYSVDSEEVCSASGASNDLPVSDSHRDEKEGPLIHLSCGIEENRTGSFYTDLPDLMSKKALESWLDDQPSLLQPNSPRQTRARITIRDIDIKIQSKLHSLLEPANGNGLSVDYSFSSEISSISPSLVCVEILFKNHSTESFMGISVRDEANGSNESANRESEASVSSSTPHEVLRVIPMEEIACLDPGQTRKTLLQVCFHHHLLPLKLAVFCNGKKYPIKLHPDIGYFVKPLSMDLHAFTVKESQLPGMFEYTRRCTFTDHVEDLHLEKDGNLVGDDKFLMVCRCLASKVLSNVNTSLVSVDMPVSVKPDDASGLCLRFGSEILSSLVPCLITITVEGKCSGPLSVLIKLNCEETVFGLNLLNRIAAILI